MFFITSIVVMNSSSRHHLLNEDVIPSKSILNVSYRAEFLNSKVPLPSFTNTQEFFFFLLLLKKKTKSLTAAKKISRREYN